MRDRIAPEVTQMPKKPPKKKAKQPKPKRKFPPAKKDKDNFIRPDPASLPQL
jgi:hypothetical protein